MDDYISRQAAIDAIKDLPNCPNGYSGTYDKELIIGVLEDVPKAQTVEPVRRGMWIDGWRGKFDGTKYWFRKCSVCDFERDDDNPDKDTNYCPNCGARMEGADE